MIWNKNLVLYACVAKGSTIVAEFCRDSPWMRGEDASAPFHVLSHGEEEDLLVPNRTPFCLFRQEIGKGSVGFGPASVGKKVGVEVMVEKANEGLKKKRKVSSEMGNGNGRELPEKNGPIMFHRQRAKHVWVVLMLDLLLCSALFGIWLWVCRGLQCVDS